MQSALNVQLARPISEEETREWHAKHGLAVDAEGVFTAMPYGDAPVHRDAILEQVSSNALRRDIPNLPTREYTRKTMVYVGGGPTIKQFLPDILAKCLSEDHDVFASNKTASYLFANDIALNYHIIVDPTERKIKDLDYAGSPEMVLGLQCHPAVFDRALALNRKVWKFLAASITNEDGRTDREAAKDACYPEDPIMLGIGGGSMCGTRMLYFAAARGYRRLEYYGVDGSIEMKDNKVVNCYAYFKPRGEDIIETTASNGRVFYTTITLARQAEELVQMMDILPGMDVEIYGDSLMANHLMLYKEITRGLPIRITPKYLALQKKMHGGKYGTEGGNHAARVFMAAAQLKRKHGGCDVLDYGSGPGALFKAYRQHFPELPDVSLREYDPAVEGKDAEPMPADVVFCGDVLEHIEPECVNAVMRHLSDLTRHVLIAVISLIPAVKTMPDGRNAHISIHPKDWWLSQLRRYFVITEESSSPKEMIAVCTRFPK